ADHHLASGERSERRGGSRRDARGSGEPPTAQAERRREHEAGQLRRAGAEHRQQVDECRGAHDVQQRTGEHGHEAFDGDRLGHQAPIGPSSRRVANTERAKSRSVARIQGSSASSVAATASILGTIASVCSCTAVAVCTRLTARPTSMPTISSGATTVSAVTSVERPRSSAKASSIGSQAAANDRVREATTRFQPSTSTNSSTFNGVDTMTGGSVNMPIEINSDDTIRSIATNGRNNAKPIWKAVLI